jgi:hypothetical protein
MMQTNIEPNWKKPVNQWLLGTQDSPDDSLHPSCQPHNHPKANHQCDPILQAQIACPQGNRQTDHEDREQSTNPDEEPPFSHRFAAGRIAVL